MYFIDRLMKGLKCSTFIRPSKNVFDPRGEPLSVWTKTNLRMILKSIDSLFDDPIKVLVECDVVYRFPSFDLL